MSCPAKGAWSSMAYSGRSAERIRCDQRRHIFSKSVPCLPRRMHEFGFHWSRGTRAGEGRAMRWPVRFHGVRRRIQRAGGRARRRPCNCWWSALTPASGRWACDGHGRVHGGQLRFGECDRSRQWRVAVRWPGVLRSNRGANAPGFGLAFIGSSETAGPGTCRAFGALIDVAQSAGSGAIPTAVRAREVARVKAALAHQERPFARSCGVLRRQPRRVPSERARRGCRLMPRSGGPTTM